jgi:hypothetical protein
MKHGQGCNCKKCEKELSDKIIKAFSNVNKKVKVRTVYHPSSNRKPDISEYKTKEIAQSMIDMILKWGIGIVSCKIIEGGE